jgi:DNA helicase-2/ATP-dependent DNA helicase PcrA
MRQVLGRLMDDFERWRGLMATRPHTDLAQTILDESGYTAMWQQDKSPEAPGRLENLKELVAAMAEFENLGGFLEHVSLVMENTVSGSGPMVSLMTLHGAKGLEFDHVFLPGWEEGLFPNQRALDTTGIAGLEEERRLAYVGLTRARRRAMVSHAANRRIHGTWTTAIPSRFIDELPPDHADIEAQPGLYGAGGGSAGFSGGLRGFGGGFGGGFGSGGGARAPRQPPLIEGTAFAVQPRPRPESPYIPGARVFHQKFGYGTVKSVENDKLEIVFDQAGTKKVMDSFVQPAEQAG